MERGKLNLGYVTNSKTNVTKHILAKTWWKNFKGKKVKNGIFYLFCGCTFGLIGIAKIISGMYRNGLHEYEHAEFDALIEADIIPKESVIKDDHGVSTHVNEQIHS